MTTNAVPNPGSSEAVARGCKCPVIDNHHGEGLPGASGPVFYYNLKCPLHCARTATGEKP